MSFEIPFNDFMRGSLLLSKALETQCIVVSPASPIPQIAFGPLVGPSTVLVGHALNSASVLAVNEAKSNTISDSIPDESLQRAVLAEASLHSILKLDLGGDLAESVLQDVKRFVKQIGSLIAPMASKAMGAATESVGKLSQNWLEDNGRGAVSSLVNQQRAPFARGRASSYWSNYYQRQNVQASHCAFIRSIETEVSTTLHEENTQAREGLMSVISGGCASITCHSSAGIVAERFWGDILKHGGTIDHAVTSVANDGSDQSTKWHAEKGGDGVEIIKIASAKRTSISLRDVFDSFFEPGQVPTSGVKGVLFRRAVCGEAALQSILQKDPALLKKAGFYNYFIRAVYELLPQVAPFTLTCYESARTVVGTQSDL